MSLILKKQDLCKDMKKRTILTKKNQKLKRQKKNNNFLFFHKFIMAKKCIICEEEAQYYIKDTFDYYCVDCAHEQFGDLSVLVTIEQQALALKKVIDKSILDEKELEDEEKK